MTKDEILKQLNLHHADEALKRAIALDAKGHFCGLSEQEKEEEQLLKEYIQNSD